MKKKKILVIPGDVLGSVDGERYSDTLRNKEIRPPFLGFKGKNI